MEVTTVTTRGVRTGNALGPAEHLRLRRDFGLLRKRGRRGGDDVIRVLVGPNDLPYSRVACAVPKRYGNAVARNRLRRQYKEAFRLEKRRIPAGYDLLLSPPRDTGPQTLEAVRDSLVRCVTQVVKRLERKKRRSEVGQ